MAKIVKLGERVNAGACPVCRKPAIHEFRPFCSRRCANLDLARWLGGGYVIAGAHSDLADEGADPNKANEGRNPDTPGSDED